MPEQLRILRYRPMNGWVIRVPCAERVPLSKEKRLTVAPSGAMVVPSVSRSMLDVSV